MNSTAFCICCVVTEKALDAILDNAGAGTYRDEHPWLVAKELLAEAKGVELDLPLLFATGDPLEFRHWTIIESIGIFDHRGGFETRCSFRQLAPVNPIWTPLDSVALMPSAELRHREEVEPIRMHRQQLDESLIRPYAICETPAFIGQPTSDDFSVAD